MLSPAALLPVACYMTHQATCGKNSYDLTFVHCALCNESCVTHSRRLCSLLSKSSSPSSRNDARIKPKVITARATLLGTAFRQSLALNINKMWLKLSHLLLWIPHSTKATRAAKCRGTQLALLTGRLALKRCTKDSRICSAI